MLVGLVSGRSDVQSRSLTLGKNHLKASCIRFVECVGLGQQCVEAVWPDRTGKPCHRSHVGDLPGDLEVPEVLRAGGLGIVLQHSHQGIGGDKDVETPGIARIRLVPRATT